MTEEPADREWPDMGPGPGSIIGELTRPTDGLRGHLELLRRADAGRVAPGVHPDVDDHTSCATCMDPGEGEELLDVSDDERLAPGGAAEHEWNAKAARHREGQWPPPDDVPVDRRAVREGLGWYQYQ